MNPSVSSATNQARGILSSPTTHGRPVRDRASIRILGDLTASPPAAPQGTSTANAGTTMQATAGTSRQTGLLARRSSLLSGLPDAKASATSNRDQLAAYSCQGSAGMAARTQHPGFSPSHQILRSGGVTSICGDIRPGRVYGP